MQTRGFGLDDRQEGVAIVVRKLMVVVEDFGSRPNGGDAVQQFLFRRLARTHALSSCESSLSRLTLYLSCATRAW
jgi:hypothetical protein